MRIRLSREFRHAPSGLEGTTTFYQPGEYLVKDDPAPGEFALPKAIADAALAADAAEEIVADEAAEA